MAICKECSCVMGLTEESERLAEQYGWTCFTCCGLDHGEYDWVNQYEERHSVFG